MNSFSRGWSFLKQAWQMAVKGRDLIKPSIYALFAGLLVALIFIPFEIGAWALIGSQGTTLGQVIMVVVGAIMIFVQYTVGYIFSAMTVYLVYGYLAEGDGVMSRAWAVVRRDFFDLLSLAAASTLVSLVRNAAKGKGNNQVRNAFAGLINTIWTEAAFLILPIMVIEDVNLKDGLQRAGSIIKNNLLLVGISTVGVKAVNGLIGFLLGLFGIGLGVGVGYGIVSITGVESLGGMIGGIGLAIIIAGVFIMLATIITSYTATAYHTCLYLWARDVEKARAAGSSIAVQAPAPLAAVLGDR